MKLIRFCLIMALTVIFGVPFALAQDAAPAAIVRFSSSEASVVTEDVEAGEVTTTLSWHVINAVPGDLLVLEAFVLNQWLPVTLAETEEAEPDALLQPVDSREVVVAHPLNFNPSTYRLVLYDSQQQVRDAYVLSIPFTELDATQVPTIESFTIETPEVNAADLESGSARVSVTWSVANRPPASNLVFQQVLSDGSTLPIELPRTTYWVSSAGSGLAAPVLPANSTAVTIRLSLVDTISGDAYDSVDLQVPIVGTATGPGISSSITRVPGQTAIISTFTAQPSQVATGGTVTLNWQTRDASSVTISELLAGGIVGQTFANLNAAGSLQVTAPSSAGSVTYEITAVGGDAVEVTGQARVGVGGSSPSGMATAAPVTDGDVEFNTFDALPNPHKPGDPLIISWDVTGAASVQLLDYVTANPSSSAVIADNLSPSGSATVALPVPASYSYDMEQIFQLVALDADGETVDGPTLQVGLLCPFTFFFGQINNTCPASADAQSMSASYQLYSAGFTVVFDETTHVFANDGSWNTLASAVAGLGAASGSVQTYNMQYQEEAQRIEGAADAVDAFLTIPDGRVVSLVVSDAGGASGTWSFVEDVTAP